MRGTLSSLHRSISSTVFALCERKYTRARSLRRDHSEPSAPKTWQQKQSVLSGGPRNGNTAVFETGIQHGLPGGVIVIALPSDVKLNLL